MRTALATKATKHAPISKMMANHARLRKKVSVHPRLFTYRRPNIFHYKISISFNQYNTFLFKNLDWRLSRWQYHMVLHYRRIKRWSLYHDGINWNMPQQNWWLQLCLNSIWNSGHHSIYSIINHEACIYLKLIFNIYNFKPIRHQNYKFLLYLHIHENILKWYRL